MEHINPFYVAIDESNVWNKEYTCSHIISLSLFYRTMLMIKIVKWVPCSLQNQIFFNFMFFFSEVWKIMKGWAAPSIGWCHPYKKSWIRPWVLGSVHIELLAMPANDNAIAKSSVWTEPYACSNYWRLEHIRWKYCCFRESISLKLVQLC